MQDTFVCGTQWAMQFAIGGITVTASATTEAGMDVISFTRTAASADTIAVALDSVDLFGWPANEVVSALIEGGRDVHQIDPANAWVDHRRVYLHSGAKGGGTSTGGRKPRHADIARFDFACLYAPADS